VTFALLFALVDILNSVFSYCQSERSRPIVETEFQVYLVVSTAMVMGLIFGLIFGALDMESEPLTNIRAALLRQQSLAYPAGALVGGAAAVMNQYLRENSSSFAYDPLKDEDLDDDDFWVLDVCSIVCRSCVDVKMRYHSGNEHSKFNTRVVLCLRMWRLWGSDFTFKWTVWWPLSRHTSRIGLFGENRKRDRCLIVISGNPTALTMDIVWSRDFVATAKNTEKSPT